MQVAMTLMLDVIRDNRELLERRSREIFLDDAIPKRTDEELNHGIPILIDQITEALDPEGGTVPKRAIEDVATRYGARLFGLGFTVAELVHAYGAVCRAVMELGEQRGASFTAQDYDLLNHILDVAIAAAVSEYQRRDNEEIVRRDVTHIGGLAHELTNTVAAAKMAFQIIREGSVGVTGRTADVLEGSLIRIGDLIERTAAEVRLQTQAAPVLETVQLADIFDQLSPLLVMEAGKRQEVLEIAVDRAIAVETDRQLLTSAVSNITQNAIKYTHLKGHVSVRTHRTEARVIIDVEDECGGLPPGTTDLLFKPFERGNHDRPGLGLGLSIAARAMDSVHGAIHVCNMPGKGCIFSIDLPSARQ